MYTLQTFPVWNVNTTSYLRLYHDVQVAMSTTSEDLFFPTDCIGRDPIVCRNNVHFGKSQFACIRGLISQDPRLQCQCSVTFFHNYDPLNSLNKIGPNRYVGSTHQTTCNYRCEGQRPMRGKLNDGVYVFEVDPKCTLDMSTFIITGIEHHSSHFVYNFTKPEVLPNLVLDDFAWKNLSYLATRISHVNEFHIPNVETLPTISTLLMKTQSTSFFQAVSGIKHGGSGEQ